VGIGTGAFTPLRSIKRFIVETSRVASPRSGGQLRACASNALRRCLATLLWSSVARTNARIDSAHA
jgi:hypothetical protein